MNAKKSRTVYVGCAKSEKAPRIVGKGKSLDLDQITHSLALIGLRLLPIPIGRRSFRAHGESNGQRCFPLSKATHATIPFYPSETMGPVCAQQAKSGSIDATSLFHSSRHLLEFLWSGPLRVPGDGRL
jgi:hypothetical protein